MLQEGSAPGTGGAEANPDKPELKIEGKQQQ